jgi:hypothetical protein
MDAFLLLERKGSLQAALVVVFVSVVRFRSSSSPSSLGKRCRRKGAMSFSTFAPLLMSVSFSSSSFTF